MGETDDTELSHKAIDRLRLSPDVRAALASIQADLSAAYRRSFVEMVQVIQRQASALERLQTSLNVLVEHIAPQLKGQLPAAIRVTSEDESPDLASAIMTADPIAAGYTMTQARLAEALGLSQGDVSALVKAFRLPEDEDCAVVVRRGKRRDVVNYHPRAIQRFRDLVEHPPPQDEMDNNQRSALRRVRARLSFESDPSSA